LTRSPLFKAAMMWCRSWVKGRPKTGTATSSKGSGNL